MKDVVYEGPHDEVELPLLGLVCARGEKVSMIDEVAEQLVEQQDWNYAAKPYEKKAPAVDKEGK
jgi:hypothetical protein